MFYRNALQELMETFETSPSKVFPELAMTESGNAALVVIFASDRGLCGPYNNNILKRSGGCRSRDRDGPAGPDRRGTQSGRDTRKAGGTTFCLGERGRRLPTSRFFLKDLSRNLLDRWQSGRYSRIDLLYSAIEGMTVKKPAFATWLPIAAGDGSASETAGPGDNYNRRTWLGRSAPAGGASTAGKRAVGRLSAV